MELLEMIKVLKEANAGDKNKLNFYHKIIVDLGKSLQPNDQNYIVDLYQELNKTNSNNSITHECDSKFNLFENIDDVKEKVHDVKHEYKEKINSTADAYKEKAKNKVEESRFKLLGGKFCNRCKIKLGFRKNKPEKIWGIQGYLCNSCLEYIKVNVTVFPALYKQGQFRKEQKVKGTLSIQNFDNVHRIVYGTKDFPSLEVISVNNLKKHELINYEEYCKKKKILTLGFRSTVSLPHLLIQYIDTSSREQEMILYIKDLSNAYSSVGNLIFSNQTKTHSKKHESFTKIKE